MSNEQTTIFVICFSIVVILIYKFIMIKRKTKGKILIDATCSDTTLRTTYQKNIRVYYYKYTYNGEEYSTSDKMRILIPGFKPKIKQVFKIYIDPKKPDYCVTPLEIFYSKIYIILSIILLVLPFLF